jgi:hypothetical protein
LSPSAVMRMSLLKAKDPRPRCAGLAAVAVASPLAHAIELLPRLNPTLVSVRLEALAGGRRTARGRDRAGPNSGGDRAVAAAAPDHARGAPRAGGPGRWRGGSDPAAVREWLRGGPGAERGVGRARRGVRRSRCRVGVAAEICAERVPVYLPSCGRGSCAGCLTGCRSYEGCSVLVTNDRLGSSATSRRACGRSWRDSWRVSPSGAAVRLRRTL